MRLVEEREDKRLRWQWQISFNRKEADMKSDITIIPSGNYHILIYPDKGSETERHHQNIRSLRCPGTSETGKI